MVQIKRFNLIRIFFFGHPSFCYKAKYIGHPTFILLSFLQPRVQTVSTKTRFIPKNSSITSIENTCTKQTKRKTIDSRERWDAIIRRKSHGTSVGRAWRANFRAWRNHGACRENWNCVKWNWLVKKRKTKKEVSFSLYSVVPLVGRRDIRARRTPRRDGN